MATETTTTLICDRCGSRHDQARYMAGNSWAQLNLTWRGDKGGRTWQGDAGGVNLEGKAWLCAPCVDAFLGFMGSNEQPQRADGHVLCYAGVPSCWRVKPEDVDPAAFWPGR